MLMIRDLPEEALHELIHFIEDLAKAYDKSKPPES